MYEVNNRKILVKRWDDSIKEIREIYNESKLSAYQSFDFLDIVGLGRNDRRPFATVGVKELTLLLYKDSVCQVVAPFYVKKENGVVNIYFRGAFTSAGQLDLIYRESFNFDDFEFIIRYIKERYGKFIIHFERIKHDSLTYCFAQRFPMKNIYEDIMVSVSLKQTYDEWFKGLSKNVRQNIRTSYNRLSKDNRKFYYDFYIGDKRPNKKEQIEMIRLFSKRMMQHMGVKSKILEKVVFFLKCNHPMTKGLFKNPDHVEGVLRIDGKMAAFFSGLCGNDNRMLIARLSINTEFYRYSPGGILINETMKLISDNKRNFIEFDLQRGDEKYKYSYGGDEYKSYSWLMEQS